MPNDKMGNTGRVPPQNIEAERSVLGGMMLDREVVEVGLESLKGSYFYHGSHELIFNTMKSMSEKGEAVDLVTVTNRLRANGKLENVGGPGYVAGMLNIVPTVENLVHYAKIVRDLAARRLIIRSCERVIDEASTGKDDDKANRLLGALPSQIGDILDYDLEGDFDFLDNYKTNIRKAVMNPDEPQEKGFKTGYYKHDLETGGIHPGRLYAWGGRPGHGKTTLLLNVGEGLVRENPDMQILFESLEMQAEEVMDKLVAMRIARELKRAKIPVRALQKMAAYRVEKIARDHALHFGDNWIIRDKRGMKIEDIIRRIKISVRNNPRIKVVLVDYLQKIVDDRGKRDYVFYEKVVGALFDECKLSDVAIIMASQVKREVSREKRMPSAADIYGGDALEQYADYIAGICDPYHLKPQEEQSYEQSNLPRNIQMQTIKNKYGPNISWKLRMYPTVAAMVEVKAPLAEGHEAEPQPHQEELELGETLNLDDDDFFTGG